MLILARNLPRTPGLLEPKHRARLRGAVSQSPSALADAAQFASEWGLERPVRRLRGRYARAPRRRWPPPWLRRPRRGAVIAFSGLDGAGKSTQARALAQSLTKLGYDAHVVWVPVGNSPALRRLATAIKRWLTRLRVGPLAGADTAAAESRILSQVERGPAPPGGRRAAAAMIWSTVITVANAVTVRRRARGARVGGRVVIYDRYVLDTVVELRFAYAPAGSLPFQEALIRRIAPQPACALLLDLSVETAHARKPDWSLDQTRVRARCTSASTGRWGWRASPLNNRWTRLARRCCGSCSTGSAVAWAV